MLDSFCLLFVLAVQENGGAEDGPSANNPLNQLIFMGVAIAFMFYFLMLRPNMKERKERQSMLDAMKKDDHVVTIGGIKAIVASVSKDEDEVVLKVDETTGTKLKVLRSSIARVISTDGATATKEAAKKES
jgi:preprotein translocase subunit YajC